ncbi:MAG TPA: hypothetical protein VJT49_24355 [Amycolatopsis sp.]|nr:hypothetical protein [Amycolatopsis sp.]HKS48184.1 hypothetical protein [Amycolatopsis sp.]
MADIAYAHGFFWGARPDGSVVRINSVTGAVQSFPGIVPNGGYGGVFLYGNGDLGFYDNAGYLRRVVVTDPGSGSPAFRLVSTQRGPSSGTNDATSCIAPLTDLRIVKAGPAAIGAGGP